MEDALVLSLKAVVATLESLPGVDPKHFLLALPRLEAFDDGERDDLGNWWFDVAHLALFNNARIVAGLIGLYIYIYRAE